MDDNEALAQEQEEPPGSREPVSTGWLVAVIANLKGETPLPDDSPPDAGAEFDRDETVQSIQQAIESGGYRTVFLPADAELPFALRDAKPDICFNLAEGIQGDGREAQVPALLEMFGIPYTASRVQANTISLDKTITKRIWRDSGLPVSPFQEFVTGDEPLRSGLEFPLFVKPGREGTGMGVDERAQVDTMAELRERVEWILNTYHQPALVEAFLPGREFTVGVLGRRGAKTHSRRPELYAADGFHRFPVEEIDNVNSVTPGIYSHDAKSKDLFEEGAPACWCPKDLDPQLDARLQYLAIQAHLAIGALDISRVDFRLDARGEPNLMEINTLPGLTPGFSDLCIMAEAEEFPYQDLILEILYLGASRFGLTRA